ncbi:DUF481 domain-containing protein [Cryomorphaceae bacterium 1068]|nr:DUF481 domain-containing protein [Cryomorphaceae bacterium 1068]
MKKILFFLTFISLAQSVCAQSDSLIFRNGNTMVGEVKEMTRGVLTIETEYSDSDFMIEWQQISEFYSDQLYTVNLDDRTLLTEAKIENLGNGKFKIVGEAQTREVNIDEIVYLRQLDSSFWSKMSASVDLGFSLTKASNLRQYNASANLGYKTDQWTVNGHYRQVRSNQDDVDPIRRTEAGIGGDYSLRNGIFFGAALNFLSNTEQQIDLRTTGSVGAGYYILRNNDMYWNGFLGVAINNENFLEVPEEVSSDRESLEGVLGTELNMYDVGDLNLFTNVLWYPSFTEEGRNRIDYRFDLSYDLPFDFYIKTGLTLNYDSQPAPGASQTDYVIVTGFGWEL